MLGSHTILQLLVIFFFSNSSRALDPRIRHYAQGYPDAQTPPMSFKRFILREKSSVTRSDMSTQKFLDLGLDGLGTYLGGVLQGVEHAADDVLGNEWSPTLDDDASAAANTTSNTKYVVAQWVVSIFFPRSMYLNHSHVASWWEIPT